MVKLAEPFTIKDLLSLQDADTAVCISIILPIHKSGTGEKEYNTLLRKTITTTRRQLTEKYGEKVADMLMPSLEELAESTSIPMNAGGIGFFVSEHVKRSVALYFPTKEKVLISNAFDIRDLLYQQQYAIPYHVLHLTEKEVRLFEGSLATLIEVQDGRFPLKHEDDYEYSRPARGSSYVGAAYLKDYEQDKSRLKQLRYEQFLKEVDKALDLYLDQETELVVCGVGNDVSDFKRLSRHRNIIAGQVKGCYTHRPLHELSDAAWKTIRNVIDLQKVELVNELEERLGEGRILTGLPDIWMAVAEGRGYQLLLEKDYPHTGFLSEQDITHLHIKPPAEQHRILADAIEDLIQLVLQKNGKITIVDNGMLEQYQHIVLITRY